MAKQFNETDLEYKRRVIDIKSDSFCAAKWYNATIWLGSGMTTSCHHPLPHPIDREAIKTNPSAIHNTAKKKQERKQMQEGDRPSGCEYCWKVEDNSDSHSDRVFKSEEEWSKPHFKEIKNINWKADFLPKYVEASFSNTCNFKCGYCLPNGYQVDKSDNRKFLHLDEIKRLAKCFSELGVNKIRITGRGTWFISFAHTKSDIKNTIKFFLRSNKTSFLNVEIQKGALKNLARINNLLNVKKDFAK